jgi:SNF2 family DNA or RNA helicase
LSGKHGTLDYLPRGKGWTFKVAPHVALRLKRIFPRMNQAAADELHLDNSLDIARDIEWFLTRYDIEPSKRARKFLKDQVSKHRERETAVEMMLRGIQEARAFDLALPLRGYQQTAADFTVKMGGLLIADDLGLGKTAVGIAILSTEGARPALVCTLTHLTQQWQRELRKFAPKLRTHILKKATPYDLTAFRGGVPGQLTLLNDFPDVLICNYQKLAGWAETLAPVLKTLVWDEAQELRREDSDKYRSAKFLADKATLRASLTATPIYNYGSEMRNVLECTRPGELGEHSEFQREWCDGDRIKDPKAFGLYLRESGLMIRRTRAEVGRELPKLTRVIHHVECDAEKLDDITSAAGELAKIILAKGETARGEKFRASEQLSNLVRQATGIAKAPYVAEFVKMLVDSGERVLLYGWHRAVYDLWMDRLRDLNPVMFTGSESVNQKQAAFEAFRDGKAKVLIMSLRAGAGLDGLQHFCRTLVFGELDYSPGVHHQDEGRPHRDGQKDPVVAYYLVSDEGSDPILIDILGVKQEQAERIVDPNQELLEQLDADSGERIKRLAEAYLAKQSEKTGGAVRLLSEARARKNMEASP